MNEMREMSIAAPPDRATAPQMCRAQSRAWFLIYCRPRQERLAKEHLERQGYSVYLPMYRHWRRRAGGRQLILEPLFPRYLFVALGAQDNWAPIRSTRGVVSLVRFGDRPAEVPANLIAQLSDRDDADGVQVLPVGDFSAGDAVRVVGGSLDGCEAIFLAKNGSERIIVLMNLLGRETRVQMDVGDIESIA